MRRRVAEQRAVAIPTDGSGALEGLFVAGAGPGGAVVAPPHPLYGGSMDSPVVNEVAWACSRAGLASLCFNWRGVGASAGSPSGELLDADADYACALAHLEQSVDGSLLACGYSWGAAAAVRATCERPRVAALVLVAPPPAMLDAGALSGCRLPVLLIAGEADGFAPPSELARLCSDAGLRAELVRVPDADHFFHAGLAEVSRAMGEWLERSFAAPSASDPGGPPTAGGR